MTPEEQAQKLAEWLDSAPGDAPPPGIDPEALEAIYALHPERAPEAKVGVDDILSRIESGPFVTTRQRQPARMRFWTGLGTLAAAAAVLLVALPQQEEVAKIGPQLSPPSSRSMTADELPPIEATRAMDLEEANEAAPPPAKEELAPEDDLAMIPQRVVEREAAEPEAPALTPAPEDEAPEELVEEFGSRGVAETEEDMSVGVSLDVAASRMSGQLDAIGLRDEMGGASSESLFSGGGAGGLSAAPASESVAAPRASARSAPRAESSQRGKSRSSQSSNLSIESLEAQAIPADYRRPPEEMDGQTEDWKIQWKEAEKARGILAERQWEDALSLANSALKMSNRNTPALSMLYYVQGRALRELSREEEAIRSYQQAIELNANR